MIVDVSMTIEAGSVFRRGTPAVRISTERFHHESEGEYESVMISLSVHTATHVDLVFPEKRIEPERMMGRGKLLDARGIHPRQIQVADVQDQVEIEAGDFVFFETGWSDFAGSQEYHDHPELSLELVEWLVARRVNAVGIDAPGLGQGRRHGECDRLLAGHDIFVIENLANLAAIPGRRFQVYCFPLKIENTDAIPARVMVGVEEPR